LPSLTALALTERLILAAGMDDYHSPAYGSAHRSGPPKRVWMGRLRRIFVTASTSGDSDERLIVPFRMPGCDSIPAT
jgi:hypothetical protein